MTLSSKHTILVCDDRPNWCSAIADILKEEFDVICTKNVQQTLEKLQSLQVSYPVLITDMRLDELDQTNTEGLQLAGVIKEKYPAMNVIITTGYATVETALRAKEVLNVYRYIPKVREDGSSFDIAEFREIVRQAVDDYDKKVSLYSDPMSRSISILHLSDLHFGPSMNPIEKLQPLLADIRDINGGPGIDWVDHLVISGDMTNHATPEEFQCARRFVSELISELSLEITRCIFVPGNHDLSWDEEVYKWEPARRIRKSVPELKQGNGYLVLQTDRYPERFRNFSEHFFEPLTHKQYPLDFDKQCNSYWFPETRIQYITINSCWEIDEHYPDRASINQSALAHGLKRAEEQVGNASHTEFFRIGVWHHPVTGNEKIPDTAFLEQLQRAEVRIGLHGHIHEDRTDLIGYMHERQIHIAGAGSFGAPVNSRPESTPRLYNLLEISRDLSQVTVHTRQLRKESGAWLGFAVWPKQGDNSRARYPHYVVEFED